jgi:hypothetical protein
MRTVARLLCITAVASVFALALPQVASAAWSSGTGSAGAARSAAMTMSSGNQPTATVGTPAGSTVDVTWPASSGGAPVAGYEVRSYDAASGISRTVGAACAGIVGATSCSETNVPDGSWRYSVTPRQQAWAGAESPLSNPIVVDSSYRALVMSDGPGAYWRVGESSGTTAVDQMGASNGTYLGGFALGAAGALANDPNTAVDLNGTNGRISVPSVPALDLTSRVTIEAWVNPDTLVGTRWIVNKGTFYYLYISSGTTYFGVHAAGTYQFITTTTVTAGAWQHLVGTYDGSSLVLYRNGVQVAQGSASGAISSTTTPVFIGAVSDAGSFFDGRLDEVAVYGSALTPAQALAHYQRGNQTRPDTVITFPVTDFAYNDALWNASCGSSICGTARDTGGGVATVAVSVRQGASGNYWNGSAFASVTEVLLPATGTTSWSLAFPAANFPAEGSYTVRAVGTDGAGATGTMTAIFAIDRTAPTVAMTFPTAGGTYANASWNAGCASRICGTAADVGSQVLAVYVSVRQGSGNYWNGTTFGSATEVWLTATGTTSWTLAFPATNFPANGGYTVRALAYDLGGNLALTSRTVTIDRTVPTVTTTFPASGGTYNNASWNAGCTSTICGTAADVGSSVASVSISIRQGSGNYWNGTAFASATEVLLPATGTTSWTRAFPATNFPAEGNYTVRAVATDLGGNTASTSTTFTIDRTSPAPSALALFDANGTVTTGTDEVRITFSEALNVSSVCSAWSGAGNQSLGGSGVVVTITDAGANDVLTVAAGACTLHIGSVATGGSYVLLTSTFSGSTAGTESRVTWTAATRVLTIHIGSQVSGLLDVLPQAAGTATYTPDAAITDAAGNGVVTTPFNAIGQRL